MREDAHPARAGRLLAPEAAAGRGSRHRSEAFCLQLAGHHEVALDRGAAVRAVDFSPRRGVLSAAAAAGVNVAITLT